MMKKGLYAILAALAMFAFSMTSCDTGGGGEEKELEGGGTKPLISAHPQGFSKPVNTTDDIELSVTVSNGSIIGSNIRFQWYKDATATGAGAKFGAEASGYTAASRSTTPTKEEGTAYYWVVVTNSKTGESAASNKATVTFGAARTDTAVEYILSANSAIPLWEFKLPDGADWEDYTVFSIDYYVSALSLVAEPARKVRSRLQGAYITADFTAMDQDAANDWGNSSGNGLFTIVNFNGTSKCERPSGNVIGANAPFIIDNSRGTANELGGLFTGENGAASKWFTVTYTADGSAGHAEVSAADKGNNLTQVTSVDKTAIDTIYVGAGIFQDGGDAAGAYEFYTRNPTLKHKTDDLKNIIGNPKMDGAAVQLFAGNGGSARSGTTRKVLAADDTSYIDVPGQIKIKFNLNNGEAPAGTTYPDLLIQSGEKLPAAFFDKPEPIRTDFTFAGWKVGSATGEALTQDTVFNAVTTVYATWEAVFEKVPYDVDLTGQTTKNAAAWDSQYSDGFIIDLGASFEITRYDTFTIVCKFYDADETTLITSVLPSGDNSLQIKWFDGATAPANANASGPKETTYGVGRDYASVDGDTIVTSRDIQANAKVSGVRWLGFQSGGGSPPGLAQFVEVISIKFDFNE